MTKSRQPTVADHEQWLRDILDNLFDAVVIADINGKIRDFNRTAEAMFGYSAAEVKGKNVAILMPAAIAAQHDQFMLNPQRGEGPRVLGRLRELEGQRKDGSLFPLTIGLSHTKWRGEPCYIASIRDISERRKAEHTIHSLSMFDAVTGLPNRSNFIKLMQHQLHYSDVRAVAVNMDFFNRINIAVGEKEGEEVIKVIAHRLQIFLADINGILAKDIEDRFWIGVVVPKDDHREFNPKRLQQLLKVLREEIIINGRHYRLTASVGVARMKRGGSASELIAHAETAVYQAKSNGRDQHSVYQQVMTEQVEQDFQLEQQLRTALNRDEFECWLQAKVDSHGRWVAAEALVRWRRKNQLVAPNVFIPLAERLGIINDIGMLMMRKVAVTLRTIAQQGMALPIAVNVSPRQFMHDDFVQMVKHIFQEERAPIHLLKIEITENLLVHNIEKVKAIMDELAQLQVQFSVDDFGTGYSNLKRLQWIPVTEVKIDRQFVVDGMQNKRGKALLDTIVLMGQSLGLARVAEGIETAGQFAYLKEKGVEQFQGYFFHRPEPTESWLKALPEKIN